MKRLRNTHPGEVLEKDFLEPMGISAYKLAKEIGVQQTRVSQIIKGKRSISADTAIRFSKFFGTSVEVWINLQTEYDIEELMLAKEKEYNRIKKNELVIA